MFAFHGFGQTKEDYKVFAEVLGKEYTFYCFDLFFHGNSQWYDVEKPLNNDYWATFIKAFVEQKNISRISLCGFSIGSKFALATVEAIPEQIEELWLLAPDGIKNNFWYNLATSPGPGKVLFRKAVDRPAIFYNSAKTLRSLGLLDKSTVHFAKVQMNSLEKRKQVYHTWTVFAGLKIPVDRVISLLNQYHIKTSVYLGKNDRIIKKKALQHFVTQLNHHELHILQTSHHKLIEATARFHEKKRS